jgi:ubiquinone/menaquinone biosynthesis C-methylase UbiE
MEMPKGNVRLYSGLKGEEKWNSYWKAFKLDAAKRATCELTVRKILELLREYIGLNNGLRILDLGCGQGDIDILLTEKSNFPILSIDISGEALKVALERITKQGLEEKIKLIKADAYDLSFKDNSFDIVLSFGYGSVGSYVGIQKEIFRVLKPGGVAIIDFRHLSIYNTLLTPREFFSQWKRFRSGREIKIYHFGQLGVKEHFRQFGLILEDIRRFNTYPPLRNIGFPKLYMLFENTFGRLFKPILSRVFLAKFRKVPL